MVTQLSTRRPLSPGRSARLRLVALTSSITSTLVAANLTACSNTDTSVDSAFAFLDTAMDSCGTGTTPRLPPSYLSGPAAQDDPRASYLYDVALTIIAYTSRGENHDLDRAATLAATVVDLQTQDPAADGRLRNAYDCAVADPEHRALTDSTSTGNMAWVGLALLSVHESTGDPAALAAAVRLAEWLETNTSDDRGLGGYTGGLDSDGDPITWKSAEHNLDMAAFLGRLATATGDPVWQERADTAWALVASLQDPATGHFWVGTESDGRTPNTSEYVPEDVQSWASLVAPGPDTARALDWAADTLVVTDGDQVGAKVGNLDDPTNTIWYEGSAHMATALRFRDAPGDADLAGRLVDSLRTAQGDPEDGEALGIPAASHEGTAGGNNLIDDSTHIGATAWFVFAVQGTNPFTAETTDD